MLQAHNARQSVQEYLDSIPSQSGVNALCAHCYPPAMRATGMGWASGIGRLGSVSGPIVGGTMLSLGFSVQSMFVAAALVGALSVFLVLLLDCRFRQIRDTASQATPITPLE